MEKRIELLPKPEPEKEVPQLWVRRLGIPLIIGMLLVFLGFFAFRAKLELDLRVLNSSITERETALAREQTFEETFRNTQRKLDMVALVKQELCFSCAVDKFEDLRPAKVTTTSFFIQGETMQVTAETKQGPVFATFLANIIADDTVKEAAIVSGRLDQDGNFIFGMELVVDKEKLQ